MTHGPEAPRPLLIAEDLLLLLTDDVTGRIAASTHLLTVLGGALLAELALDGTAVVDPASGKGIFSTTKILAVAPAPGAVAQDTDPLLRDAWALVAEKPRGATELVARLGKGTRDTLTARLVERGILERVDSKVFGIFPSTRWPAADTAHEGEVRQRLHACLVTGLTPDPRTAALIGLLNSVDQLNKVVESDVSHRELKRRAKAVAEGDWASAAVQQAVQATNAAVMAGIAAATTGAVSSS